MFGFYGRILTVDLTNRTFTIEPASPELLASGLGGKGLAHIVGGSLCINIVATLQGLAQTFGLETLLIYVLIPG